MEIENDDDDGNDVSRAMEKTVKLSNILRLFYLLGIRRLRYKFH